jgi:hypothetical protein
MTGRDGLAVQSFKYKDHAEFGYGLLDRLPFDPVLTHEFERLSQSAQWSPEKELLLHLLLDAVQIIEERKSAEYRATVAETVRWFQSDDESWPCSFVRVCEALGLDGKAVRTAVLRNLPEKKVKRIIKTP